MSNEAWVESVTALYVLCNASRLAAYVPQVRCLLAPTRDDEVAVSSWLVFAAANASAVVYAIAIQASPMLAAYSAANLLANLLIAGLAMRRHRLKRRARPGALASGRADRYFYAATFAACRSSGDDGRHRDGIDAAFLDPVAGDHREAVGLQFRPFGDASGVGMRAAWMKGAA